jgi:large subunit ribosomal protein L17
MRFALTARAILRDRAHRPNGEPSEITALNVKKVTQFRENGEEELESMVERMRGLRIPGDPGKGVSVGRGRWYMMPEKEKVYPEPWRETKIKKARN